jgi:hypothetical protein
MLVHKDLQDKPEHLVLKAQLAQQASLDSKGVQDQQDPRVHREVKALRVKLDRLVQLVRQVDQARKESEETQVQLDW